MRNVLIQELLTTKQLNDEGKAMKHCVASYSYSCSSGRCAIYSLKVNCDRKATIEVDPRNRQINQVRAKYNAKPDPVSSRVIHAWAGQQALIFSRWAV